MLRFDLCDCNDAYIVVRGLATFSAEERDRDEMNRNFFLENNALQIFLALQRKRRRFTHCNAKVQFA